MMMMMMMMRRRRRKGGAVIYSSMVEAYHLKRRAHVAVVVVVVVVEVVIVVVVEVVVVVVNECVRVCLFAKVLARVDEGSRVGVVCMRLSVGAWVCVSREREEDGEEKMAWLLQGIAPLSVRVRV